MTKHNLLLAAAMLLLTACAGNRAGVQSHSANANARTSSTSEHRTPAAGCEGGLSPFPGNHCAASASHEPEQTITAHYRTAPQISKLDQLLISSDTRIYAAARIDTTIKTALNDETGVRYSRVVLDRLIEKLRTSGKNSSVVVTERPPNDGRNILIDVSITPNASGNPYVITLTATQGRKHWAKSMERPYLVSKPGNMPILPGWRLPDGRPYWDPLYDAVGLGEDLAADIIQGS